MKKLTDVELLELKTPSMCPNTWPTYALTKVPDLVDEILELRKIIREVKKDVVLHFPEIND
jgi:hypothetical protein